MFKKLSTSRTRIALIVFLGLGTIGTSCRFGNNIQLPTVTNPDTYSGMYAAELKEVNFSSTTVQATLRKAVALSAVPSDISSVMTNPVGLALLDSLSGKASLQSKTGDHAYPITIQKDSTLLYQGASELETLWRDSACKTYLLLEMKGAIAAGGDSLSVPGNTLPLLGRLGLSIKITNILQGTCTSSLLALSQCYHDPLACGSSDPSQNADTQGVVIAHFQPWIDAQVITPDDISTLTTYGYEALYE